MPHRLRHARRDGAVMKFRSLRIAPHLAPFVAKCHIAYFQGGRIVLIVKLAPRGDLLAAAAAPGTAHSRDHTLFDNLRPVGVMVDRGLAQCMTLRGVKNPGCDNDHSAVPGFRKTRGASPKRCRV